MGLWPDTALGGVVMEPQCKASIAEETGSVCARGTVLGVFTCPQRASSLDWFALIHAVTDNILLSAIFVRYFSG